MIEFVVHGLCKGAGSKRPIRLRNGKIILRDSAGEKGYVWSELCQAAARQVYTGEPLSGALLVIITFRFQRPQSHYGTGINADCLRPTAPKFVNAKTDVDKLLRRTLDALTGVIWDDDKRVARVIAEKVWHKRPGAYILVEQLENVRDKYTAPTPDLFSMLEAS